MIRLIPLAILAGLLAACSTEPSRFYHLSAAPMATAPAPAAPSAQTRRVVGIDTVDVPGYLDRPEIVLRAAGSRLVVKEFDRWGGPLDEMVTRALEKDLEAALPEMEVVSLPLTRDVPLTQAVEVALDRFDASEDGPAVLEARWRIFDRGGERLKRMGRTAVQEAVATPGDPGAIADALSRTLTRLAADIAAALR
ncbi:PqiC family protein [Azospirillum rugosum]|uniref:Lipoprotein YmbA n=1 Tax=Azospirillum rugosum TaxID=416170 RepID=A0ABS4SJI3_9PROT|nr:PqiC family protein [Azospirillum rugosum]MBP2292727.1 putative lipoprotein YmbA [Azospirillum rugosum]MDQ0526249.1 putative lipoprotein YmbA [Azospirillum rugosum]